ncbi:MAG: tripartite tricarboxylate transporter substrate binding protein [Betaproteobacteria bacterium]|nr:tripartite tricarboxylate transporter substrate binding protein [Betaproteobacteria bacterium]
MMIAVAALCLPAQTAWSQSYPSKPVRLISPFPPGGGTDAVARVIAQALSDQLGQQVVVDSRGGASGMIGVELAAKSAPDGYTLVMGNVIPLAMLPSANPKVPYVPLRDFSPISLVALTEYTLTVHPSLPVRTVKEFLALARKRPGELTYASSGNFSGPHLSGELLNLMAKIKLLHVPYKGTGPAALAVMAGETTMMFGTGPSVVPHMATGKLRGLATTGLKRSSPDLPAFSEILPGYEVTQWYGLLVPAGTPKDIVDRLHKETVRAIATPKVSQVLTNLGTQPVTNSPDEFRAFVKAEGEKWGKVIKAANLKAG